MPKNQDIICGAMQPGGQDGACLLCPRWSRPGRITNFGSRTHFYVLISLPFHRKFNKQICSGIYKAGFLSGPGSRALRRRLASGGMFWRAGLRWSAVRA